MALQATQVDCQGCGAKVDIHAGLRTKTFVCEYCGSVCEGGSVVAVQEMAARKERYKPWSHLRLGMTANLLGQEYQIIGRIRSEEKYWWWDEWFLYSKTGFPLWLQEGEGGFTIFRVFYPTFPVDPRAAGNFVKLDNKGGHAQVRERGHGKIVFIEGELTWAAKPGEEFDYIECYRKKTRYSIEYSEDEIQYIRGESRDPQWVYEAFGITEAPPAPLVFDGPDDDYDDDDDDDEDEYHSSFAPVRATSSGDDWGKITWTLMVGGLLFGVGLLVVSLMGAGKEKHIRSFTFKARAGSSSDSGVLLRDRKGKPIQIKLPKSTGAYEIRLASSGLQKSGYRGGHCFWASVDFLKDKTKKEMKAVKAWLKEEDETLDQWHMYNVVHRVGDWFGLYWGVDEGESWTERNYVKSHFFRTKDPGPYYLRVYTGNCKGASSQNPVGYASLTIALYRNVWMTRWVFWAGIILIGFVMISLFWRASH